MSFTVYPAIDVRDGRVVRLFQGDYARETRYAVDPFELACEYARAGARWLHLVDLDAARAGGYTLLPLLDRLVHRSGLSIQTGGGVRGEADVEALLKAGAQRVVVGSLAVRDPQRVGNWLADYGPDRITVALDARLDAEGTWRLPTSGWTRVDGEQLETMLAHYAACGLRHVLCTDIDLDGTLAGPNVALYQQLASQWPRIGVQASGGVRDAGDVAAVRDVGCGGVVLGKSLLDGALRLDELLEATC